MIKQYSSPGFLRKYLEYLTINHKVNDPKLHTELALSYINEITNIVDTNFTHVEGIDEDGIQNDKSIFELRRKLKKVLETSKSYNLNTIFINLPHQYMLHEIAFILACDRKYNGMPTIKFNKHLYRSV